MLICIWILLSSCEKIQIHTSRLIQSRLMYIKYIFLFWVTSLLAAVPRSSLFQWIASLCNFEGRVFIFHCSHIQLKQCYNFGGNILHIYICHAWKIHVDGIGSNDAKLVKRLLNFDDRFCICLIERALLNCPVIYI